MSVVCAAVVGCALPSSVAPAAVQSLAAPQAAVECVEAVLADCAAKQPSGSQPSAAERRGPTFTQELGTSEYRQLMGGERGSGGKG